MIIFDLTCQLGHRFEGWFQSREDFDAQLARGLLCCPQCASPDVWRVPSAVHLGRATSSASAKDEANAAHERGGERVSQVSVPQPFDPRAGALTTLQQLAAVLLANCEDVGERFAEEARRIHYLEAPERAICGVSTAEDYEALRDEGIEVLRLPLLKVGDLH